MKTFQLIVSTLDEILVQESVSAVYFPTPNGEIGVLTDHITYLTNTLPGHIRYKKADSKTATIEVTRPGVFFIKENQARLWLC